MPIKFLSRVFIFVRATEYIGGIFIHLILKSEFYLNMQNKIFKHT